MNHTQELKRVHHDDLRAALTTELDGAGLGTNLARGYFVAYVRALLGIRHGGYPVPPSGLKHHELAQIEARAKASRDRLVETAEAERALSRQANRQSAAVTRGTGGTWDNEA
jgi:hypothetical protein